VNSGGLVLAIVGAWIITQATGGNALHRLGLT
jgi:hypothetical protein